MNQEVDHKSEERPKIEYRGNKIPLFIKIVWGTLIVWALYYSFKFAIPNLGLWLNK